MEIIESRNSERTFRFADKMFFQVPYVFKTNKVLTRKGTQMINSDFFQI